MLWCGSFYKIIYRKKATTHLLGNLGFGDALVYKSEDFFFAPIENMFFISAAELPAQLSAAGLNPH